MGIMHKVSPAINRFHCAGSTSEHEKIYRQRSQFTVSNENTWKQKVIPGPHKKQYTNRDRCWFNKWKYYLRHNSKNSTSIYRGCFFQLPRYIFQKSRKCQNSKRTEKSNIKNDNSSKRIGKIGICSKYRNGNHNCMKRHDLSENKIQIQIL